MECLYIMSALSICNLAWLLPKELYQVTDSGNNIAKMQGRWSRMYVCFDHWCAFTVHSVGWGIPSECTLSLALSSAAVTPRWPQRAHTKLSAFAEVLSPQVGNKDMGAEGVLPFSFQLSFAPPFSNPHVVKHKGKHPEDSPTAECKSGRMMDKCTQLQDEVNNGGSFCFLLEYFKPCVGKRYEYAQASENQTLCV